MELFGVDFSGAKSDDRTWVARGHLEGDALVLRSCEPLSRGRLGDILAKTECPAVAALDFPFSVPLEFGRWWVPGANEMPHVWAAASAIEVGEFTAMRDVYVAERGETKRVCDSLYPESYSCLHKANPNLVPMTFHGMRMLARLWPGGCDVPPLEPHRGRRIVLLEVMPGAVLRTLRLPYKGYKNGVNALALRRRILGHLRDHGPVPMANLDEFEDLCAGDHDALDAVVAAVAAALWAADPGLFRLPPPGDPTARLEGWLYAPAFGPGGTFKGEGVGCSEIAATQHLR